MNNSLESTNFTDIQKKLNQYTSALDDRGYINGSILVAYKGNVVLCKGFGMANFELNVPNTPQTKFRIGSLTKSFTAMAIMQLQEQGMLNVHDSIEKYIPHYPNGDQITVHHLLIHTSGIPNHATTQEFWNTQMRLFSPSIDDVIALFRNLPLLFTPGDKFAYSNGGYILLTAIIEQLSGLSYADYLYKYIFEPLGMMNTGYDDGRVVHHHKASSYLIWEELIHPEYQDMSKAFGAYGLYSTVDDLYLWESALNTEKLVKMNTLSQIFTPYHRNYGGYGWHVTQQRILDKDRKKAGHLGDNMGFIGNLIRYPDDELMVVFLSNVSITPVEQISVNLAKIVLGEIIEAPKPIDPIILTEKISNQFIGTYKEENDGKIMITKEHGKLFIETVKRYGIHYKYELIPVIANEAGAEFITKFIDEKVHLMHNHEMNFVEMHYWGVDGKRLILFNKRL